MAAANVRRLRRLREEMIPRNIRDRTNPMDGMDEGGIFSRYRFHSFTIHWMCGHLQGDLEKRPERSKALPNLCIVLMGLQYLASGAFQIIVGDKIIVHKSTASRVIREFLVAIGRLVGRFVRFPVGEAARRTMEAFHRVAGACLLILSMFYFPIIVDVFS